MDQVITTLINVTVVPLTAPIPFLASSGILLAAFAALWAGFAVALVRDRSSVDRAWLRIRRLPLGVQAIVWLLFLPVMAGMWIWRTTWPAAARASLVACLAAWNLLVFLPQAA